MHTITITLDSLTNARDLIADGVYKNLPEYKRSLKGPHVDTGIIVKQVITDRENDLILGIVEYPNLEKLKAWMASDSPELSDEDIDQLIEEAISAA